jgi:valyl-tRNA synthetase
MKFEVLMKLDETYDPLQVEDRWYPFWLNGGWFAADTQSKKQPYTIMIPPPNVTGSLHMGHALFVTLEDLLIRWKRMDGFEALWLPGTDHAGIATQVMVERQLAKDGTNRHELGREEFLKRVWTWKEEKGGTIIGQMKRMGASCDWERERFTMDEGLSVAVREAFVQLFEQGLIYRAERMVDWDPVTMTVLSDLEVDREEEDGKLWFLKYPLADGTGHIVVGTTRPETMLGDTAVAVHPDDERYKDLIGKMVKLPIVGREIPIIADKVLPDPKKGSGAVKITPAHDPNDFECGERHNLERIQVIGFDACMNENCPENYQGKDRYEARKMVIADFEKAGLLDKIEPTKFAPGRSQRSGVIVEPLPMLQWFVNTEPMAKKAIDAVDSGRTKIVPEVWKKTYDHFMHNIRPWCISRQLWWGHRIPAWYCDDCNHITVAREDATQCAACASKNVRQEEDVLDTWFSSGLWPFSTLGWPEKTPDLEKFYPTQCLETGFDILFFWVARMLMMGCWFMDDVPFDEVFLHAMVRDAEGHKMSKTKGNIIDPLHLIYGAKAADLDPEMHAELLKQHPDGVESQGADALRFTLAIYAAQGRDIKLDIDRVEGYRAFLNKLWNAARFALMNLTDFEVESSYRAGLPAPTEDLSLVDKWILQRLAEVTKECQTSLEAYKFNEYAQGLYHFVWHEVCDWYIEFIKMSLYEEPNPRRTATQATLLHVLETSLRLLHPAVPFITEDIWQALPRGKDAPESLMIAPWPRMESPAFTEEVASVDLLVALINQLRAIRGETRVKPSVVIPRLLLTAGPAERQRIEGASAYIQRLARVEEVVFIDRAEADTLQGVATAVVKGVEIRIPLKGLIDLDEERGRLKKELSRTQFDIDFVSKKLANEKFVAKAPPHLVQAEREKLAAYEIELRTLEASLLELETM